MNDLLEYSPCLIARDSESRSPLLLLLEDVVEEKPGSGSTVEIEGSGDSATNFSVERSSAVILSSSVICAGCSDKCAFSCIGNGFMSGVATDMDASVGAGVLAKWEVSDVDPAPKVVVASSSRSDSKEDEVEYSGSIGDESRFSMALQTKTADQNYL